MNYKVVFIDWYNTLSSSRFWSRLEDPKHPNYDYFLKIQPILFSDQSNIILPWMRGQLTSEEVVDQISDKTGTPKDLIMSELIYSCKNLEFISENSLDLIKSLRKAGLKVVIATDNMDTFMRWTVPSLKLRNIFDGILDSFNLKALKQDFGDNSESLFFSNYLKENLVLPGESVLIDDSMEIDNKIQNIGIEYMRIVPGGLDEALRKILKSL